MKIVLAGSPAISIAAFEKIINNFEVVAIVTQPDAKQGRGLLKKPMPIALLGKKYNILTFKPNKIITIYEQLKALNFDLFLTFAFGQWIPTKILQLGNFLPLNIHGSLLPKYRGAAPIHYAILNGDQEIGITLMVMVKEMDAGDMIFKAKSKIDSNTNVGQAFKIIARLAEKNIVFWLQQIEKHNFNFIKQGNNYSLAPKIEKSFGKLNLSLKAQLAIRKIRGLNPFPGAYIFINKKRVKIFEVSSTPSQGALELKFQDQILYAIDYQYDSKKRKKIL